MFHIINNLKTIFLDLRGVFSPPLMITDQTASDLSLTGRDRSVEYYFASDARYHFRNKISFDFTQEDLYKNFLRMNICYFSY